MKEVIYMYVLLQVITCFSIAGVYSMAPTLTSSLGGRLTAYPQEVVTFTCKTVGSLILGWDSDQYIGDGILLEFTSLDTPRSSRRSKTTIATLNGVTTEDGEVVLESTLQITALPQFPTSSVTCRHIDNGTINSITFSVTSVPAQQVNCTFRQGLTACPGDKLNFTCETRDSNILAWSSDQYIGPSRLIEFTTIESPGSLVSVYPANTTAFLMDVSVQDGVTVIECGLNITVLPSIDHQGHSVTCINVDVGTMNVTTFYLAENCDVSMNELLTTTTISEYYSDGVRNHAGIRIYAVVLMITLNILGWHCSPCQY